MAPGHATNTTEGNPHLMSTAETPENPLIQKWINTLWPDVEGGWLSVLAQTPAGDRRTLWAQDSHTAATKIGPLVNTHNIWLGCATRAQALDKGRRGGASDCVKIPGLWLDIDILGDAHAAQNLPETVEQATEALAEFPLAPSIVVHSGNGLQPWWLFSEPVAVADTAQLLDDWAWTWEQILDGHGWQLDGVFDIARILRVPGTLNHKTDPPKPVTVHDTTKARYGLDDIEQWLTPAPPKPEPARKSVTPYIGPQRAGDHFNMAHTGGEILAKRGWTLVRTDRNGDEHYRHPTSTNATSATVYADDGHTTIWTTSIPELQAQRPYDPFGLYAALNHGSRFSEARQALTRAGYGSQTDPLDILAESFAGAALPALGEDAENDPPTNRFLHRLLDEDGLANIVPPVPLLNGWLYRNSIAFLIGPPKKGKTFVALDLAMAIATGTEWVGGTATTPGKVLYILGEGIAGIHDRVIAWRTARDVWGPANITFLPVAVQLKAADQLAELYEVCAGLDADLIIIDTFARAAVGVDENSSKEMGEVIAGMDRLKDACGACIMAVHHTGKDPTKGYRGSSALEGAWDTAWKIEGDLKAMQLLNYQQKNVADGHIIGLTSEEAAGSIALRRLDQPPVSDNDGEDRFTVARQAIISAVRRYRGKQPLTYTGWRERVTGVRVSDIRPAFLSLVDEGYFDELETEQTDAKGRLQAVVVYVPNTAKFPK